jgi:ribosomal 50S subunit-associated protein YjgA (DUF615 family)
VNPVLHCLAVNPALPSPLVDRLIASGDDELAREVAWRADLDRGQVRALVARFR